MKLAEVLVGAVFAGGVGLLAVVLQELACVAVGLDDLFERDAGVYLGWVLVAPVGFE